MRRDDFTYPRISKAAFRLALPALIWVTVACGDSDEEAGESGDDQVDAGEVADDPPDAGEDELISDAAPACSRCGDIVNMDEFDPDNLCDASQPLFDALFACLCGTPEDPGVCADDCADNACAGTDPSDGCGNCAAIDCGPETGMCLNDA